MIGFWFASLDFHVFIGILFDSLHECLDLVPHFYIVLFLYGFEMLTLLFFHLPHLDFLFTYRREPVGVPVPVGLIIAAAEIFLWAAADVPLGCIF